jgi:hypothetical protein
MASPLERVLSPSELGFVFVMRDFDSIHESRCSVDSGISDCGVGTTLVKSRPRELPLLVARDAG